MEALFTWTATAGSSTALCSSRSVLVLHRCTHCLCTALLALSSLSSSLCRLLGANICSSQQAQNDGSTQVTKTLQFGKPVVLSKTFKRFVSSCDRWVPTAFGHVRAGGAWMFSWIQPNEHAFAPFGGFMYRFRGSPTMMFPARPH